MESARELYNDEFYKENKDGSRLSASKIMPFIVKNLSVKSIVDFGCGTGCWLKVAQELDHDIKVMGLDWGHNENYLFIKKEEFQEADLTKEIDLQRKFDLVMTVEVAEHLPKESAETFVKTLCAHGDVVLFSAAFSLQGGLGHINEAPLSYWKNFFDIENYEMVDIRPLFWTDKDIQCCYRQNMVLFIKSTKKELIETLKKLVYEKGELIDIVLPEVFLERSKWAFDIQKNLSQLYAHTIFSIFQNLLTYEEISKNNLKPFDKNMVYNFLANFDGTRRAKLEKMLALIYN